MLKSSTTPTITEQPTTELYIVKVVGVPCMIHDAKIGDSCFMAKGLSESSRNINGICNNRAKRAGMNGRIQLTSFVRFTSKGSDAQRR